MKNISCKQIEKVAYDLIVKACTHITPSCKIAMQKAYDNEVNETAKFCIDTLIKNSVIANDENMPVCQDTGMAVFLIDIGQDVHITDGFIEDAINNAVSKAYTENYFRKSVCDPLTRKNTNDNTPAMITYHMVKGENIKISFLPKGFGSENMSKVYMLKPADGRNGIVNAVMSAINDANSRPCPPIYVGIGIGGTFDKCTALSKLALTREVGSRNARQDVACLEEELLEKINQTNIGAQGFGGNNTAIGVSIEVLPTHIAGLPVAVNIQCNCVRFEKEIL